MNGAKLRALSLIFFSATILVPVLLTGIASADCGLCVGDDFGGGIHCSYNGDLLRCGTSAARDCDPCTVHDCDLGAVSECDRSSVSGCGHCITEYRCDLYGCAWIR